jgi:hypothetical protein
MRSSGLFQYEEFRIACTTGNHNLHSDMKDRESIEGWIHSKRRNRLGQDFVERLVRTHTNLQLEHRLEFYEAGMLPWDIEMTVEEKKFRLFF